MNTPGRKASPAEIRHIVRQSAAIHPTWTFTDHLHYLENDEFIDIDAQVFILAKDTYEQARHS